MTTNSSPLPPQFPSTPSDTFHTFLRTPCQDFRATPRYLAHFLEKAKKSEYSKGRCAAKDSENNAVFPTSGQGHLRETKQAFIFCSLLPLSLAFFSYQTFIKIRREILDPVTKCLLFLRRPPHRALFLFRVIHSTFLQQIYSFKL